MFELELDQAAELIADTNIVIAEYYDSHDGIKDKIELIERILAKSSLAIAFLLQFRYQILKTKTNTPQSSRIVLDNLLAELKVQLDALKTISFNFTTLMNSSRDKYKEELNVQ